MASSGSVVTADVWRIPPRAVPAAMLAVARDPSRLRRLPGARFVKVLGTSRSFSRPAADLSTWVVLAEWDGPEAAAAARRSAAVLDWQQRSVEHWHARLQPLKAHGRWSRREPFAAPGRRDWDGPVAAVTRARLVPSRALQFWRATPAPAADLARGRGLRLAIAMGEAPLGVQGTFSVWQDPDALQQFAYGRPAHRAVVRRTREVGWYAEELFARFGVLAAHGTVGGRDPLAAAEAEAA